MKRLIALRATAAALVIGACLATQAFAADIVLQLTGIEGNSRIVPGAIDVHAYSHGVSVPVSSHVGGGGGGAGKASFSDLTVSLSSSKATPKLLQACVTGKHIPEAKLTIRKSGGKSAEYLVITMQDVLISSYSGSGSADSADAPSESLSLNFTKIKYEVRSGSEFSEFNWNLLTVSPGDSE